MATHLAHTRRSPRLALCEPLHADAERVRVWALLFPHIHIPWAKGGAFVRIEALLDFGEKAELDCVEELVGVGGGADVDLGEGGVLHGGCRRGWVDRDKRRIEGGGVRREAGRGERQEGRGKGGGRLYRYRVEGSD